MSVFTHPGDRQRLSGNAALAGKHKGERCFVLATGPSLRDQDLAGLEHETVMTVNQGFFFARTKGIAPAYHCMVDDIFLESRFDALHHELCDFLKVSDARLLTTLDLSEHYKKLGLELETFPVRQILNSRPWDEAGIPVSVDPTQAVPGFVSVVHAAVSWAIYMGFAEIYLLGCDMDYFISPHQAYKRCYDDERHLSNQEKTSDLFGLDQIGLIEWILVEFRAFDNLGRTARRHGARIMNAGEGGALNVYPRIELGTVLGTPKCTTTSRTEAG
ncbi:6-hydroxymethylpterin diphosphokinase MptE-like protein [Hoeflea sp.]|uniref:6-hydroxymethylpterin diphosphokinase MptE-like protein n=1 Tax=Hoeflea sp. TaxID=1940281 RepID=UPI003BAE9D9E